jgi:hypoxanthine-DNA glycosylase
VKSREECFFYGHKQNRFWRVVSAILGVDTPKDVEGKRAMMLSNKIALWDVIASCEIEGSADSTIKNVTPNDLTGILREAKIEKIFVNGKTAEKYYNAYIRDTISREATLLPSTSPANAAWSVESLISAWRVILE